MRHSAPLESNKNKPNIRNSIKLCKSAELLNNRTKRATLFQFYAVYTLTLARFASLAVRHVVEDVLHGATVGQVTLPYFPTGLLPPLALMGMEQKHQLLLYEFALFWVGRWRNSSHCCCRHGWWSWSGPKSSLGVKHHTGYPWASSRTCWGRLGRLLWKSQNIPTLRYFVDFIQINLKSKWLNTNHSR